jgi:hypothetical protein
MAKGKKGLAERRSFIRLREPISITYSVTGGDKIHNVMSTDISADGLRFQTRDKGISEGDRLEMKLDIHEAANAIHAEGKVIWKELLSLEDNAPLDVGVEFVGIEEDNKNTFLKFLCDLIYNLPEEIKNEKRKKS